MQRLFVDMDGTLAVFQPITKLETLYEQGYFFDLLPNINVVNAIRKIATDQSAEVYILSSVLSDSEYALEEKNAWLDKYLPEIPRDHRVFPPCGQDKKEFIPDGIRRSDYLLDDYTTNLILWQPPARGIKLLNGINHSSGTWKYDRIRYDKAAGIIEKDILSVMQGRERVFDEKPDSAKKNVVTDAYQIIPNVPGYYDSSEKQIGVAQREFLFVRFRDNENTIFGRVMRNEPGSILIVDEVSGETHFLASGSKIVGHYDRFGEEIYRDPLETIDTDKIYTRNGWKEEGENFFVSSNEVSKEDYRTNNGITFCYRGVPPDADKMFGMIQFIGHGALVETVYLQTQEKYDEWVEDSQGCPFRAFVNPRYRKLLNFNKPCLDQTKEKSRDCEISDEELCR